jgi:hypothetical protein
VQAEQDLIDVDQAALLWGGSKSTLLRKLRPVVLGGAHTGPSVMRRSDVLALPKVRVKKPPQYGAKSVPSPMHKPSVQPAPPLEKKSIAELAAICRLRYVDGKVG